MKKSSNALTMHIMYNRFLISSTWQKLRLSVRSTSQMVGELPKLTMVGLET